MFIEGARWNADRSVLDEQLPRILVEQMPMVHFVVQSFFLNRFQNLYADIFYFQPILKSQLAINKRYECPLYKTSERRGILSTTGHSTNYIAALLLPTHVTASHWTKRATALICQTND